MQFLKARALNLLSFNATKKQQIFKLNHFSKKKLMSEARHTKRFEHTSSRKNHCPFSKVNSSRALLVTEPQSRKPDGAEMKAREV